MAEYEELKQPWTILQSREEIIGKIKQNRDKIVVIFFHQKGLFRDSVDYQLKEKRSEFKNSVLFFKCDVIQNTDELPHGFDVKRVPTVLFYRNGEENPYQRLVKPTKDDINNEFARI